MKKACSVCLKEVNPKEEFCSEKCKREFYEPEEIEEFEDSD